MPMFDVIGTVIMWNLHNIADNRFRELRVINPNQYNNIYIYLHMGLTGICVAASLITAIKYY